MIKLFDGLKVHFVMLVRQ